LASQKMPPAMARQMVRKIQSARGEAGTQSVRALDARCPMPCGGQQAALCRPAHLPRTPW
jgi:hypothetical protein